MLNFTGMVRVAFAVPCPVLSLSVLDHQVSMLKRSQNIFLVIFLLLRLFYLRLKVGYDNVDTNFD